MVYYTRVLNINCSTKLLERVGGTPEMEGSGFRDTNKQFDQMPFTNIY